MSNPLIRKLKREADLTREDLLLLERLCKRSREIGVGHEIVTNEDPPENVHLLLNGLVIRYKMMRDGGRQIVGLILPGDFCDLQVAILGAMDYSLAAATFCTISDISISAVKEIINRHPRITRALWRTTLVDEAIIRTWLANVGRLEAEKRMAHLFCELSMRLDSVGLVHNNSYDFPLKQMDLADLLGISTVHVNRTLQSMRGAGLLVLRQRKLEIPDIQKLKDFCDFNPAYLDFGPCYLLQQAH